MHSGNSAPLKKNPFPPIHKSGKAKAKAKATFVPSSATDSASLLYATASPLRNPRLQTPDSSLQSLAMQLAIPGWAPLAFKPAVAFRPMLTGVSVSGRWSMLRTSQMLWRIHLHPGHAGVDAIPFPDLHGNEAACAGAGVGAGAGC